MNELALILLCVVMMIWIVFGTRDGDSARVFRGIWIHLDHLKDLLKLKQKHLQEDVRLRKVGLENGIVIQETTLGLWYKATAYLLIRLLNQLAGTK